MAEVFTTAGVAVGLCARSQPAMPAGDGVVAARVDVTDAVAVDAFAAEVAERLGPIDLWVNNAGVVSPVGPVRDLDAADMQTILSVNAFGAINGSRAFLRHRHSVGGGGVLVNMSSAGAQYVTAGMAAYCASKAAIDRFTEAIAKEEADVASGIRAYAVWPGLVDTAMLVELRSQPADRLPEVGMYHQLHDRGALNSVSWVAKQVLGLATGDIRPPAVVWQVPDDPGRP
jgi:NAD(P)-dependent dehydrogenase (short-subunit alcohol dehydrogenase family)